MVNPYEISKEIQSDEEGREVVVYLAEHFGIKLANEHVARTIQVDLELSQESLDCLIEMAGYGINYWASSATQDDEAKTYTVTENEEGEYAVHVISYDKIIDAFWKAANPGAEIKGWHRGHSTRAYALSAVTNGLRNGEGDIEAGDIDSDLADNIIQLAAFGEVIYG